MSKPGIDIDAVLAFKYDKWDLGECSIRHYLVELGKRCWDEGDAFSGKRPFGNSGWSWDVYAALVSGGFVQGRVSEDGVLMDLDEIGAERVVARCFERLREGGAPSVPVRQPPDAGQCNSIAGVSDLIDALRFYASASTYHAMEVLADQPAGEFADDFSDDHGDEFYQRAMPGRLARETLKRLGIPW